VKSFAVHREDPPDAFSTQPLWQVPRPREPSGGRHTWSWAPVCDAWIGALYHGG